MPILVKLISSFQIRTPFKKIRTLFEKIRTPFEKIRTPFEKFTMGFKNIGAPRVLNRKK